VITVVRPLSLGALNVATPAASTVTEPGPLVVALVIVPSLPDGRKTFNLCALFFLSDNSIVDALGVGGAVVGGAVVGGAVVGGAVVGGAVVGGAGSAAATLSAFARYAAESPLYSRPIPAMIASPKRATSKAYSTRVTPSTRELRLRPKRIVARDLGHSMIARTSHP
jgi:hypothetical protein